MAVIRLVAVLFVVEVIFYVLLSFYLRSTRAEALEEEWDRRHPGHPQDSSGRKKFVRRAMAGFQNSIKARLVGLVFILPTIAILVIAWLVNVQ